MASAIVPSPIVALLTAFAEWLEALAQAHRSASPAEHEQGVSTPAAAAVEMNRMVPLMIGRAVQGGTPEEAVDWAAQKVEAIYAKYK